MSPQTNARFSNLYLTTVFSLTVSTTGSTSTKLFGSLNKLGTSSCGYMAKL